MKNTFKSLLSIFILLGLLILCVYLFWSANPYWLYWPQQRQLAQELGVKINDYPASYAFPVGYFHSVLKVGSTTQDVHRVIQGYEKVFRCDNWYGEVYYYFSPDDSNALRFEVQSDENFRFDELRTEDENSRTISVDGCIPGSFEE
jgi:hypothetical protein